MGKTVDIHKAAGVLLKDRKFLITRTRGKEFFIAPGGRLEAGESVTDALIRELKEELSIDTKAEDFEVLGTFYAPAAGAEDKYLQSDVFIVKHWAGEIIPAAEVEEVKWIDSNMPEGLVLGSIFLHDVLPALKERNLID